MKNTKGIAYTGINIETLKIMSVLSATTVRGIPRKSYGLDPANGNVLGTAWNAATVMPATRTILTYGLDTKGGIPFTWAAIATKEPGIALQWN